MSDRIDIKVVVHVGDRTLSVASTTPITLSGDRRRWRRQITEHLMAEAEALTRRFDVPTQGAKK